MRYLSRYMTAADRPAKRWTDSIETDNLELAKIDCAVRRTYNPEVQHTQVVDRDQDDKQVYFVDNRWAAIYDLAHHAGHPDPKKVADALTEVEGNHLQINL